MKNEKNMASLWEKAWSVFSLLSVIGAAIIYGLFMLTFMEAFIYSTGEYFIGM